MKKKQDYDFLVDSKFNRFLLKVGEKLYDNLNKLYYISILLFFVSLAILGFKYYTTGSLYKADYTISGGIKYTFAHNTTIKNTIEQQNIKVHELGNTYYFIVPNNYNKSKIEDILKKNNVSYNVEEVSALLKSAFFKTLIGLIVFSFILVILSILMIYKDWKIASIVGRALLFNLVITFSITNLFIPLSKYILPAYLMILGYGIDTNLILINHMLKERKFDLKKRFALAFNTGIMIHLTTLTVLLVGFFLANNEVFKYIFAILAIGLLVDIIDTWFLNGYLLKKFVEEKEKKL
ncbi:MAG: hypothetical protein ABGW69_01760 [Nanoarchaeota archaeon]